MGDLKYFLGLELTYSSKGISLTQWHYTLRLLEDTRYLKCKPCNTPMEANIHLNSQNSNPLVDSTYYHRLIGCLVYLIVTRLDIAFAIHKLNIFPRSSKDSTSSYCSQNPPLSQIYSRTSHHVLLRF